MESELILVYNADSSMVNLFKDRIQKTFFPNTYECRLCALAYGTFTMKEEWKTFFEQLNIPYELLHRDEFYEKLTSHPDHILDVEFPAIFLNRDGKIQLFITHEEINACNTLLELMNLISSKLNASL